MVEHLRLLFWHLAILAVIVLYPLFRKLMAPKQTQLGNNLFRNLGIVLVLSITTQVLFYQGLIQDSEYLFFQLVIILVYFMDGFDNTHLVVSSDPISIDSFNPSVLQSLSKGYSGSSPEKFGNMYKFTVSTPYFMKYQVEADEANLNQINFRLSPRTVNHRIYKILLFTGAYLTITSWISQQEQVAIPLLDFEPSAIIVALIILTLVVLITRYEVRSTQILAKNFPNVYRSLLKREALSSTTQSTTPDIKGKAEAILNKKNSSYVSTKRSELQNKVEDIFGTNSKQSLDPETIRRVQLMEHVKRILISTPPWRTVSLDAIVEAVAADTEEIEIIIAGLIQLKEVSGIYDYWSKEYSGSNPSHWYVHNLMTKITSNGITTENVKIYPDGGVELNLNSPDKK